MFWAGRRRCYLFLVLIHLLNTYLQVLARYWGNKYPNPVSVLQLVGTWTIMVSAMVPGSMVAQAGKAGGKCQSGNTSRNVTIKLNVEAPLVESRTKKRGRGSRKCNDSEKCQLDMFKELSRLLVCHHHHLAVTTCLHVQQQECVEKTHRKHSKRLEWLYYSDASSVFPIS